MKFIWGSSIFSTFTVSIVLLLKWRSSQYNKNRKKKPPWLLFSLVCCEKRYEKAWFFNSFFQNPFQDVILRRVLKSQNLCYLNDGPINIIQNVKRTLVLLLLLLGFYVKLFEGTINFQYIFLKLTPVTHPPGPCLTLP